MKKVSKEVILAMPLSDFGIKPLTNWMKRRSKQLRLELEYWEERCKNPSPKDEHGKSQECLERCKRKSDVQTVGDLIRVYPYRFVMKWRENYHLHLVGLGSEPIAQLKKKLVDLGLTSDDWPALVKHDELLKHLSKNTILKLPFLEVYYMDEGYDRSVQYYFGCNQDELPSKTVADFIAINPMELDADVMPFLKRRKYRLIAIRQQLAAKGFTTRDGAFMKWDPDKNSLEKAMKILKKYKLHEADRRLFAEIIVAERWVC